MKTIDVVVAIAVAILLAGVSAYAGEDTQPNQQVIQAPATH